MNMLYYMDNLEALRRLQDNSVDFVYADPPFNSDRVYTMPATVDKQGGEAFKDDWKHWDSEAYVSTIKSELQASSNNNIDSISGKVLKFLEGMEVFLLGEDPVLLQYLTFMSIRFVEIRRVLKNTGSIYLHCDMSANAYLRALMDVVFERKEYKEIIWKRHRGHRNTLYGRMHDTILYYGKPDPEVYKQAIIPYTDEDIKRLYPYKDKRGLYAATGNLLPMPAESYDPTRKTQQPWKGYEPLYAKGVWSNWTAPRRSIYAKEYIAKHIPGYLELDCVFERLDALADAKFIHWCDNGRPYYKVYYYNSRGAIPQSIFTDIVNLTGCGAQITNYPTQKPIDLLKRLIQASSMEGQVVLDPFCGSGTTLSAAQALKRQWIGIDCGRQAIQTTVDRLAREYALLPHNDYMLKGDNINLITIPKQNELPIIQTGLFQKEL